MRVRGAGQVERVAPTGGARPAGPARSPGAEAVLETEGLTKTFGSTTALSGLTIRLVPGRVHGLIGENGSGKSTFVKIVSGVHRASAGTVRFGGHELGRGSGPVRVACVYQDGSLVEELSVAQNLDLIVEPDRRPAGTPSWYRAVLNGFGLTEVEPRTRVGDLPNNVARLVEIAGVLARNPDVLLFDESTSTLDEHGVARVLAGMRAAADRGACVVFVTHRLHEVLAVSDDIAVLRDGVLVAELPTAGATPEELVRHMAGREVTAFTRRAGAGGADRAVALRAVGLRAGPCGPVELTVRAGEIVGIGGAAGNGQRELIRALAGDGLSGGTVEVAGTALHRARDAVDAGAVFVSSDRRSESLSSLLSIRENYTLALDATSGGWWRWLPRRREVARAGELADRYGLVRRSVEQPVATLSGGNQQKVAIGRAVAGSPAVLLVEEPTEGVDVRSRFDIYRSLVEVADRGTAVVFTSSDASELRMLADRAVVLARGRLVAEFAGDDVTEEAVVHAFTTAQDRQDADAAAHGGWAGRGVRRGRLAFSTFSATTTAFLLALLVALGAYGAARDPQFATSGNYRAILDLGTPLALAALAQLPVLLIAEIDASVGSMMGLLVVVLSYYPNLPVAALFLLAVAGGAVLGLVNAVLVVALRINSVIATIATLGVFLGVGRVLRPVPGGLISASLSDTLARGLGNVPVMFVAIVVLAVAFDLAINLSRRGLRARAVGYSAQRATQLGVRSAWFRAGMYVLAGAIAGLGSVALAAQTGAGDPSVGSGYTLLSIAVPVIGGALLTGGRGSAVGCVLAAVFVAEVQDFVPFVNLPTGGYLVAVGALTVTALVVGSARWTSLASIPPLSSITRRRSQAHA